jgi:hypothetical protein
MAESKNHSEPVQGIKETTGVVAFKATKIDGLAPSVTESLAKGGPATNGFVIGPDGISRSLS